MSESLVVLWKPMDHAAIKVIKSMCHAAAVGLGNFKAAQLCLK